MLAALALLPNCVEKDLPSDVIAPDGKPGDYDPMCLSPIAMLSVGGRVLPERLQHRLARIEPDDELVWLIRCAP